MRQPKCVNSRHVIDGSAFGRHPRRTALSEWISMTLLRAGPDSFRAVHKIPSFWAPFAWPQSCLRLRTFRMLCA